MHGIIRGCGGFVCAGFDVSVLCQCEEVGARLFVPRSGCLTLSEACSRLEREFDCKIVGKRTEA